MLPNTCNTVIILIINLIILGYSLWLNKKIYKSYAYISLPFVFNLLFVFFYIGIYAYIIFSNHTNTYFCFTKNFTYPFNAAIFFTICNIFYNIGCSFILLKKRHFNIHSLVKKYIRIYKFQNLKKIGIISFLIGITSKIIYFIILGNGNIFYYFQNYFRIQVESVGNGVGFDFYLRFLFTFAMVGASILLVYSLITKKNIILTSIAIILTILINFNSRLSILTFLLQLLILSCLYLDNIRKKLPYYFIIIILPIFFIIIIALGILRDSTNGKLYQNIDIAYFALGNIHDMRALSDGLEYNSKNDLKYYGMTIIAPILFKPIPRKIWENKPRNAAAIYTEKVTPGVLKEGFAIAPGIVYEAFINFGYIGSLIYFSIIGYLLFFIQTILFKEFFINKYNAFFAIIISLFVSRLLYLRGEDLTLIYTYSSFFIINYLLIFIKTKIKI